MTWYAPLEISPKKKKKTDLSRSEEALSEFVRVVVLERERPLCPTHTSYCILDAYGRWEFVITPTSGRRTDDSRIAETRILRNSKTLKCDRASTIVCVKKKKTSARTLRKMIHRVCFLSLYWTLPKFSFSLLSRHKMYIYFFFLRNEHTRTCASSVIKNSVIISITS